MTLRSWKHVPLCAALTGATWLGLAGAPADAQHHRILGQPRPGYCPPPPDCLPVPLPHPVVPTPKAPDGKEPAKKDETTPPMPPTPQEQPSLPGEQAAAAGGESFAAATGFMMGDQLGIPALAFSSRFGSSGSAVLPTARGFKVSENESPRPIDRFYVGFNYFEDVNAAVNTRIGAPIRDAQAYRTTFGFEKTFFDRDASIGFRVPVNTFDATGTAAGFGGSDTSAGDLSIITKYAFWQDEVTGSLMSGGLAVTLPTGPSTFAGANIAGSHSTLLQPYVGYILNRDRFFVHGFTAFAFATQDDDVTFYTFDIGAGYRLYRGCPGSIVTGITPSIEAHLNVPLNHRGALDGTDPIGAADVLNLTYGATISLGTRSTLALALVTPVTGPRPFYYEFIAQFNWRFGPSARDGASSYVIGN
jgi:hypothetical protein